MIRSTKHHLKDLNKAKALRYKNFVLEYSRVVRLLVDQAWVALPTSLVVPKYYNYKEFDVETDLSARALSSAVTQVSGILRASVEKQRRRLWVRENKNQKVKDVLIRKPELKFVAPNLSSKCCDIVEVKGSKFWGFVRVKSLGKAYGAFNIPIIRHPRIRGTVKSGVIFFLDAVQLAWEVQTTPALKGDRIMGLDQGYRTVATLSDGQASPDLDSHGHSLVSVIDKLTRKRKGSKAFKRAQEHRKNFVNWSINQLNFSNLKELRLEKIVNIRKGVKSSKTMSHWCNPEIRDKIKRRCEELEVPVVEQSCAYRSQRCSSCGQVRKANRKGKIYECKACGHVCDADLNAAMNHEQDLPPVQWAFLGHKLNLGNGFFWKPDGFWDCDGAEIRVPCS